MSLSSQHSAWHTECIPQTPSEWVGEGKSASGGRRTQNGNALAFRLSRRTGLWIVTPTSVRRASATDQLTCQSQRHGKVDHTVSTPWGDGWGESVLYKIINRRLREGVASDTQGESHAQCSQPQRRSGTASRRGSTGSHPWGRRCHQAGEARAEC